MTKQPNDPTIVTTANTTTPPGFTAAEVLERSLDVTFGGLTPLGGLHTLVVDAIGRAAHEAQQSGDPKRIAEYDPSAKNLQLLAFQLITQIFCMGAPAGDRRKQAAAFVEQMAEMTLRGMDIIHDTKLQDSYRMAMAMLIAQENTRKAEDQVKRAFAGANNA